MSNILSCEKLNAVVEALLREKSMSACTLEKTCLCFVIRKSTRLQSDFVCVHLMHAEINEHPTLCCDALQCILSSCLSDCVECMSSVP